MSNFNSKKRLISFSISKFIILSAICFSTLEINIRPSHANIILDRQVNNLIRQADNNFKKNNYSKAIEFYTQAIQRDSSKAELFLLRARAYQAFGDNKNAIKDFNKTIEIDNKYLNDYQFLINRSLSYEQIEDYSSAINDLNKVIILKPENIYAYNNRGKNKLVLKEYNSAIDDFSKSISIFPNEDAYYWRARVYEILDNYDQALFDYTKAIELDPNDHDNFNSRGVLNNINKKYSLAFEDFKKAHKLAPTITRILNNLCDVENNRKNYESAISYCTQSLQINDKNYSPYKLRSTAYWGIDNYESALNDINSAIELYNQDRRDFVKRGILKSFNGDFLGSIDDFNIALENNPNDSYLISLRAYSYLRVEDYPAAIIDYTKLTELEPNNENNYYYLGKAFLENEPDQNTTVNIPNEEHSIDKRRKIAIEYFDKAIEIDPNNKKFYDERAFAKSLIRDFTGALKDFSQSIELDPEDKESFFKRGLTYMFLEDKENACKDFEKTLGSGIKRAENLFNQECTDNEVTLSEESFIFYWGRGVEREKDGDNQGAIDDFTKAIEIKPNNKYAYNSRALTKSKIGDKRGAIEDYTKGLEIDPSDPLMYRNRGSNKLDIDNFEGAIDDFNKAIELTPNDAFAYFLRAIAKGSISSDLIGSCGDLKKASDLNFKEADELINKFCK